LPKASRSSAGKLGWAHYLKQRDAWMKEELAKPGTIRPAGSALRMDVRAHIEDFAYVEQDDSIIQDALQRLTYAHRLDHTPKVECWAFEELELSLSRFGSTRFERAVIARVQQQVELGY
jgi:hypothetical protein